MKKKLNLLWNLKFNFFSVAERPLTFFAYFLNAKKVGRRRLVIGPAKAGAFLFSHTRLPFPPRPLLPFGRISPAAKPGWPVVAPAGGNVLATPFSLCSNVAPHIPAGSAGVRSFVPRLAPRSHPGACRRSAPFRCAKPRWPVVAPAGGNVLATPFSLRSNVAPRSHPGLASIPSAYVLFFGAFFGAKMPLPGHAFAFLPAGASFRFVSPRGRGVRHPYGSSSAAAFMVAAPVTYTLPAFLNAPDSSTTALVLPFATFTTRSATP